MAAEDIDTAIPIGHDRGAFMAHALPPLSGTRRRVAAPGHAERRAEQALEKEALVMKVLTLFVACPGNAVCRPEFLKEKFGLQ
ncbi:hypothetical protein RJ035_000604 [Blastomyces gilchristii]